MAKCSQCLHWDACSMLFEIAIGRKPTANGNKAEEQCPHFKDKTINTNADRIRAMSDEELVKLIGHNCLCDQIQNKDRKWCESKPSCDGCLHEWLKQPVEVEDGQA